jgi:CheY-like chemotaxis protein
MEAPALAKVSRPFEQGDSSISGRFGGMGLGLAISRELMTLHGGQLSATSDGKDCGACFTVQMCAVESSAAGARQPEDDAGVPSDRDVAPRRTWRLLLVDDHRDTLRLTSRLLEHAGHDVTTAATVAEALEVASRQSFDLVVSDLGLPDASGLDLMRTLRDLYPMRGIALSGYGAAEDIAASREAGFDLHLTKPVDFARLLEAIDEVAAAPKPAVPAHV